MKTPTKRFQGNLLDFPPSRGVKWFNHTCQPCSISRSHLHRILILSSFLRHRCLGTDQHVHLTRASPSPPSVADSLKGASVPNPFGRAMLVVALVVVSILAHGRHRFLPPTFLLTAYSPQHAPKRTASHQQCSRQSLTPSHREPQALAAPPHR